MFQYSITYWICKKLQRKVGIGEETVEKELQTQKRIWIREFRNCIHLFLTCNISLFSSIKSSSRECDLHGVTRTRRSITMNRSEQGHLKFTLSAPTWWDPISFLRHPPIAVHISNKKNSIRYNKLLSYSQRPADSEANDAQKKQNS